MQRGQAFPNPYSQSPPFVPKNEQGSPMQQSPNFYRPRGSFNTRGSGGRGNYRHFPQSAGHNNFSPTYERRNNSPYQSPNNSAAMNYSYNSSNSSFGEDRSGGGSPNFNNRWSSPTPTDEWRSNRGSPYQRPPGSGYSNPRNQSGGFKQRGGGNRSFRGGFHSNSSRIEDFVFGATADPWRFLQAKEDEKKVEKEIPAE